MKISVVIPSLNAVTLPRTLRAVQAQSLSAYEIIVVGRDEAGVMPKFAEVRFLDTKVPVCAAAARNRGIEAATGEVILSLTPIVSRNRIGCNTTKPVR